MKIVVLQGNEEGLEDGARQFIQGIAAKLETQGNEVRVENQESFSASDEDLVVVFGKGSVEKARELKETNEALKVAVIVSEVNVSDLDTTDANCLVLSTESNQDLVAKLKEAHQEKIIEIGEKRKGSSDITAQIVESLNNLSNDKKAADENTWSGTISSWAERAQSGAFEFYKNNRTAINVSLGATLLGGAVYAGSRTEAGKEVIESARGAFGLGSSSSSSK